MYKVMLQNVHLQGGTQCVYDGGKKQWNKKYGSKETFWDIKISPEVIKDVESQNPDIIIFTEFWKFKGYEKFVLDLEKLGYKVILNSKCPEFDCNQILIALKNNFEIIEIVDEIQNLKKVPNFLHAVVKSGDQELNIIGVRVRQGKGKKAKYVFRKEQMETFQNYCLSLSGNTLIGGDFNHGQIRGKESNSYSEVRSLYNSNGTKWLVDTYNYHILKDLFKPNYLIHTPVGEQYSWRDPQGNTYKLDHFISKGLKCTDVSYLEGNAFNRDKIGFPAPDHKMCIGYFEIQKG